MSRQPTAALAAALAAVAVAAAGVATAAAKPVTTTVDGLEVDWSRGVVIASAGASADLRAPSASIARVKAERIARRRVAARLVAAARKLPLGAGLPAPAESSWERLAVEVVIERVSYASDGSAVAHGLLPIEAVRRALVGPDKPPPEPNGPTALVIDARAVVLAPALGMTVAAGAERYSAAVLFFSDPRAATRDPRAGKRLIRATATSIGRGAVELGAAAAASLTRARRAGALVIVLMK